MAQTLHVAAALTASDILTVTRRAAHIALAHAHHVEVEMVETLIHLAHSLFAH